MVGRIGIREISLIFDEEAVTRIVQKKVREVGKRQRCERSFLDKPRCDLSHFASDEAGLSASPLPREVESVCRQNQT